MGKKLRFPLKMEDEIEVRTLKELKDNFSLTKVLDYVSDGKLIIWLRDRSEDEIADAIEKLDSNSNEFPKQICEVFGINNVAFCQDDLYDLLDEQYDTIYLYGDKFEIPINRHNITYIGFNNPIVIVNSEDEVDWEERKISLSKVQFDDKYKKLLKYKKFVSQFKLTEEIQKTEVYTMYIEKIMEKIYDVAANHLSKEGLETLKGMLETYKYDETPDYIINAVAGIVGESTDMEKNIDTLSKYFANDKYDNVAELIQKIWNYYRATVYSYSYHKAPTEEKEMEVGMCLILLVYYQYEKQLPIPFKLIRKNVLCATNNKQKAAGAEGTDTKDNTTSDEDTLNGMKELISGLDNVEFTEEDAADISKYVVDLMVNKYLHDVPEDKKEELKELMKESVTKEYKDYFEDVQIDKPVSKNQNTGKPANKKTCTVTPISKQEPDKKSLNFKDTVKSGSNQSKAQPKNSVTPDFKFEVLNQCYSAHTGSYTWMVYKDNTVTDDEMRECFKKIYNNIELIKNEFSRGPQVTFNWDDHTAKWFCGNLTAKLSLWNKPRDVGWRPDIMDYEGRMVNMVLDNGCKMHILLDRNTDDIVFDDNRYDILKYYTLVS